MRRALTRLAGEERGQVLALAAAALAVLLGMAGMVVDVGSWYRSQRQLQSVADAAALAAAQDLPQSSVAANTANAYIAQNLTENPHAQFVDTTPCPVGGGLLSNAPSCEIDFPAPSVGSCPTGEQPCVVRVRLRQQAQGFFAKVINSTFGHVYPYATATARFGVPLTLSNVAPIAVPLNPNIECVSASPDYPNCFGIAQSNLRTLDISSSITSSGSAILNLDCHQAASPPPCNSTNAQQLSLWITNGDPNPLPTNQWYGAVTGGQVGGITQGLSDTPSCSSNGNSGTCDPASTVLFFPIYDDCSDSSSPPATGCQSGNDAYHVLGFSAFAIQSYKYTGNTQQITGYFVKWVAKGSLNTSGGTDYGVHIINLTH